MPIEDYQNLTDADFENLPPLVPKGANREEVLAGVIDRWVESSHEMLGIGPNFGKCLETIEAHPAVLKRIDLRDDNSGANPIDLGEELLKPLNVRLQQDSKENGKDIANEKMPEQVAIYLLGCKVQTITAKELSLSGSFNLFGCKIAGKVSFERVHFYGEVDCSNTIFSWTTVFSETFFYKFTNFKKTAFPLAVIFGGTTFKKLSRVVL